MTGIRNRFSTLWALIALLILAPFVGAQPLQSQTERIIRQTPLGKATLGLLITDLTTGQVLASRSAETPLVPASNLKLLTTAAALSVLGADFQFTTQLATDDKVLILRGSGDPAFGDPVVLEEVGLDGEAILDRWVASVKQTGRVHFEALLVDDRVFDQQFLHPNWPSNQLLNWYCAQVGGVNFNSNCVDFYASPSAGGRAPTVRLVPDGLPLPVKNQAVSGSGKTGLIVDRKPGSNELIVRGNLKHKLVTPTFVTFHDPAMTFAGLLRNRLRRAGVEVAQVRRVAEGESTPLGRVLAEVRTPIATVLTRTNRDSQNLFAEALLKRIGHEATGRPGGWDNGRQTILKYLYSVLGAEADKVVLDDGCGLSRVNRVSPAAFIKVMEAMHRDTRLGDLYLKSLAQPGQRGTLRTRLNNNELTGHLYAKSGYVNGAWTLSGYLVLQDRTVAFSMLLNGFSGGGDQAKGLMDKILVAVDKHFAPPIAGQREAPGLGG